MAERIHPTEIAGHKLTDLAVEVGRLRYDALAVFLDALRAELERQGDADQERGRIKLYRLLYSASGAALACQDLIEQAFAVSAPHMQDELAVTPSLLPKDTGSS